MGESRGGDGFDDRGKERVDVGDVGRSREHDLLSGVVGGRDKESKPRKNGRAEDELDDRYTVEGEDFSRSLLSIFKVSYICGARFDLIEILPLPYPSSTILPFILSPNPSLLSRFSRSF